MDDATPPDAAIAALLDALREGDAEAMRELVTETYGDLHRLARAQMAGHARPTLLDTTGLVNEWYLRMAAAGRISVDDRRHFFVLAARIMRQVACAYARKRLASKRGEGRTDVALDDLDHDLVHQADQFVELDEALDRLAAEQPRLAQVVELRFFGGLTEEEASAVMAVPLRSVQRLWADARARLLDTLGANA